MRHTLLGLATGAALLALAPLGASAAPGLAQPHVPASSAVQQADWYCGWRCEQWRHRRWEHERWERHHRWEQHRRWEEGRYYPYRGWYGYR